MRLRAGAAALLVLGALTSCSHLPAGAPTASEFERDSAAPGQLSYLLLDLDPHSVQVLAAERPAGLAASFGGAYRPSLVLRPGDVVAVTVFELTPIALLGPSAPAASSSPTMPIGGHAAALPPQAVELDGSIDIPFGGHVRVGGLSPAQAAGQIERALAGQATNPQAVVSLVSTALNTVSVGGDVGRPGLVPLTLRGERVLDAIAGAGGTKYEYYDCTVQLTRDGRAVQSNLQRLVDDPAENVAVRPGDTLFVAHDPRSFSVLGSALKVAQYDFTTQRVTLAEAIARAGGPNDAVADVGQLYLLRFEPHDTVQRLLPDGDPRLPPPGAAQYPVAYHLDLRRGAGYFLAQAVQMHDKDVVLVANAASVELQKLLGLVREITGIYFDLKRSAP